MGDSAGGNLVLNLVDIFDDIIDKFIVVCPVVSDENLKSKRDNKILDVFSMLTYFKNYGKVEKIIPSTNKKILLFLAENDVLYEQGQDLYNNLKNCECYIYENVFHIFMHFDYSSDIYYQKHFFETCVQYILHNIT
jgi:acetyl esterase/lipase